MIARSLLVAAFLLAASGLAHGQGNVENGKQKSQPCQACHGPDGNTTTDGQYPRIAGQYADYLAKSMRDYKTGARKNAIMAGFVTTLTDQDIEDLAAYYAAQQGDLTDLSHLK